MLKKIFPFLSCKYFNIPVLILMILTGFSIISCDLSNNENDEFVAQEIAESIANPENGMIVQINDVVNLFKSDSKSAGSRSTIIISTENGELNGFLWDPENEHYERTGSNLDININDILIGTINTFTATCKFFNSTNTTGPGVRINPGRTIPVDIHSMIHTRDIDTSLSNTRRNVDKEIVIDVDYNITGIHDSSEGVTVNGTRIATCESIGQNFTGNWVKTINLENVTVIRERDGDTVTYIYYGNATISFEGIYVRENGNTKEVSSIASVKFNGTKNVTVTIDGSTIIIDITTGEIVE